MFVTLDPWVNSFLVIACHNFPLWECSYYGWDLNLPFTLQMIEPWKCHGGNRRTPTSTLPGASVRNSARGKGHEEGGSAYAKAGSRLRSLPGNSRAFTPKTRVCLLYCFVVLPTPLTLRGLSPTTSLWKRVKLQFHLIKFLGVTRVF